MARDETDLQAISLLDLTGTIVAAYVSKNPIPASEVASVIRSVHSTLNGLSQGHQSETSSTLKPAVSIKKSVTDDYIICLEDGKKLKMLKRYLRSRYNLTPDAYRQKWGLPIDYPMVAPDYAARRSEFAKKIGLGRSHEVSKKRKRA